MNATYEQVIAKSAIASAEYRFSEIDTNCDFCQSERHRFNFKLARYF